MVEGLPDSVVHYAVGAPFLSVTASMPSGQDLAHLRAAGRFSDPDYIPRRRAVEHRLRESWLDRGGEVPLHHPLYFTLGRHPGYETQVTQGLAAYEVSLSDIPPKSVTWTFGDSLVCFDPTYRTVVRSREKYRSPCCGKLYALSELERVREEVARERVMWWEHKRPFHHVVEVQVWMMPDVRHVRRVELCT